MRIALVGPAHPYKGGGARHTTELAHRLAEAGHETAVESWRAQYPRKLYPGEQTITEPEGSPYPRTRRDLAWYRPDGWWRAGRRLGRGADLVVLVVLTPVQVPPYLGLLRGLAGRARTLALCHNVLPHERRTLDPLLMRALLRRVDTVLAHSEEQRNLALDLLGTGERDVRRADLPPHLPGARAAPPSRTVSGHLLFLGMVRPYKGVDLLLRALAAGPPGVSLTVAGEFWGGSAELRELAERLGVAGRVHFREGYVPAEEVPSLFERADALVLPYRSATATQNAWWAHEHGRPVIATRVGSLLHQVRDGVDGVLCEPGDAADLAAALHRFYTPGTPLRLRGGVRPVDPRPYWRRYLAELTGIAVDQE